MFFAHLSMLSKKTLSYSIARVDAMLISCRGEPQLRLINRRRPIKIECGPFWAESDGIVLRQVFLSKILAQGVLR